VVKTARLGKTLKGLAILSRELKVLQVLQGRLDCPKVLAYGYYDSVYALALEWIPDRDMKPNDACHLPAALHSLRTLHALGYKHGDLRLENVRVNNGGKVFLLDFGAAKPCFDRGDFEEEEHQQRGVFWS
jgi:serine/threonine protein kinase